MGQKGRVSVVGLGYIGLPTALMLAAHGVEVVGTDYDAGIVEKLRAGELTFRERGLKALYRQAVANGIWFTTSYEKADLYIVSVATPYLKESKKVDPRYLVSAVEEVLSVCGKGAVLVIESTIPPGTIDRWIRPLLEQRGIKEGEDVHLAHAPERIIPGDMIRELTTNPRTIGAESPEIGEQVREVYRSFCTGEIVLTDIRTAEMSKVVENAYRDVNIAFANELSKICRAGGLDVREVIRIANHHPRVDILSPGPGVGGHCISVDPWFLVGDWPEQARLIRQARDVNDSMPGVVLARVQEIMEAEGLRDPSRVGFYGVTYKEDVDDVRESPTLQLVELMEAHLAPPPKVFDPMCARDAVPGQYHDFQAFLDDIDLMVLMVRHSHLREAWPQVRDKVVLDTRDCALDRSAQRAWYTL